MGHRLVENRIEVCFFFFAMIASPGWPWFKIKTSEIVFFLHLCKNCLLAYTKDMEMSLL